MDGYYDLGGHSYPVTTGSREAQTWFDRGLIWTYGYNHEEAVACFRKAIEADPNCAMAHWGLGYAAGPNYNMPWHLFDEAHRADALATGFASAKAALEQVDGVADWEAALLRALPARYPQTEPIEDMSPWNDDFADAMRAVFRAHGNSLEVRTIFAEALLNRTPWKMWDLKTGKPAEGASTEEARNVLEQALENDPAASVLTAHPRLDSRAVGIVGTALGPMLISSRPILRSDDSGPIAGALIMGQFMNEARMARLAERTEVDLHWHSIDSFAASHDMDPLEIASHGIYLDTSGLSVSGFMMLSDLFGEPLLVLDADTPRRISALGDQTVNAAMLFLIVTGIFVTIVIWYLLRGSILMPINRLVRHIKKIRESGDLSHRLTLGSGDEIGALATEFGDLTSEVHEARKALLYQSFKAGKADTATEVLHNIRNAMTPMINGLERLAKSFTIADELRVDEATGQLSNPDCPPERAGKFIEYIDASFARIKAANKEARDDMKIIRSQAGQIEAILADQEKFANVAPVEENIIVNEVVGEAAHVIPKEARETVEVEVDQDLARFRVRAHRIGLLQVLGNLILNAYESIERCKNHKGHIALWATDTLIDDKPMVRLTVRDNGTGFEKDMSQRLFQRGYTSKSGGSTTGLGLHWCANAVAGMGGRISAESRGAGQGAEFHVLLPAAQGG